MSVLEPKILTVTQLNRAIKREVESEPTLQDILVRGEISGVSRPSSGHLYFTLKDTNSQIPCVLFKRRLGPANTFTAIEHGMKVICGGSITVYEPGGKYQLKVEEIFPEGLGKLHLDTEELKQRLKAEGLFESERKRPLPAHPRKLGVVTSATGAAIRDIVTVSRRRYPNIEILLSPALVQGAGAPASIVSALEDLYSQDDVDVIIVGRGGGSFEELNAFNHELVARTIAVSPVPIVSAVGHETDFTIADLVADLRAPTPSAAAELVVPRKDELCKLVDSQLERALSAINRRLYLQRRDLERLSSNRYLNNPLLLVEGTIQKTDELTARLWRYGSTVVTDSRPTLLGLDQRMAVVITMLIRHSRGEVSHFTQRLQRSLWQGFKDKERAQMALLAKMDALSPLRTLARGYSICQDKKSGKVVVDHTQVAVGQDLQVKLSKGSLAVQVMAIGEEEQ